MMIRGYEIAGRTIAVICAIIALMVLAFAVPSCLQKRRSEHAQAKVDEGQGQAAQASGKDAIGTVTEVGANAAASEDLGRQNERDIRSADGANVKVPAGVNAAGRAALCKRAAYRNDPKCKAVHQ